MKKKLFWLSALALSSSALVQAQPIPLMVNEAETVTTQPNKQTLDNPPVRQTSLRLADSAVPPGPIYLSGINQNATIAFNIRSDEIVSDALLDLEFTPSPSLIPHESHVKVFLNDELMGIATMQLDQLGKKARIQIPIDTRYVKDYNIVRLQFIGHYQQACENPGNNALWLDISKSSTLNLNIQPLAVKNDLSHFPEPFFDSRDNSQLTLPVVFAGQPTTGQQRSAAVLASWFGTQTKWRGQQFPVLFNQLPQQHAVVFATNQQRPDFLRDYPPVNGPVVEMISHPDNPYVKLLLILGRDDNDLFTAVRGIAQGNLLFSGSSVTIDSVLDLAPRKPYDAPNWVRTDRPMTFAELQTYAGQLQSRGEHPSPITLTLNLPPDLYLSGKDGINMQLKYRYTPPEKVDGSRLSISLNDGFITSYDLSPNVKDKQQILRLPILQGLLDVDDEINIPMLKPNNINQLKFSFDYINPLVLGAPNECVSRAQTVNYVGLDDNSTIDFSGYRHFIAMPDLRAFVNTGFPFSRMADLSETLLVVNSQPQPEQVTTLLNLMATIGAQTGYPALAVRLTDNWQSLGEQDADLLLIGTVPVGLNDDNNIELLVNATQRWIKMPGHSGEPTNILDPMGDALPESKTTVQAEGPIAAIIGFESPNNSQRSVVALLANGPEGYKLLNSTLNNNSKRADIFGSTSVIRQSGISSVRVGETYYVGYIPWWQRVWYTLAAHPILLSVLAIISVVLLAMVLWRTLRYLSHRRLSPDRHD